jgi:excisionase family DNA binding protein
MNLEHNRTMAVLSAQDQPNNRGNDRLIKVKEAASLLGVCVRTVWALRSRGRLTGVSVGGSTRFRLSDIQQIIREGAR